MGPNDLWPTIPLQRFFARNVGVDVFWPTFPMSVVMETAASTRVGPSDG
jgi:hypothetical protein